MAMCTISSMRRNGCRTVCSPFHSGDREELLCERREKFQVGLGAFFGFV